MAGRRCFIKDNFISVQSCEDHQSLEGTENCEDCEWIGVDPSVDKNSKEAPCAECKRLGLTKPGRGLCGTCYTAVLKKEKEEKEALQIPDNPNPPPVPPVKEKPSADAVKAVEDYEEAEERAVKIGEALKLMTETPAEPRDYSVLINVSIALLGFGWVIALYWLGGGDFTRGRELAGAFSIGSVVGALVVWLRR